MRLKKKKKMNKFSKFITELYKSSDLCTSFFLVCGTSKTLYL